jgi:hypothetical protein
MGRTPETLLNISAQVGIEITVELFTWENRFFVDQVKAAFGL